MRMDTAECNESRAGQKMKSTESSREEPPEMLRRGRPRGDPVGLRAGGCVVHHRTESCADAKPFGELFVAMPREFGQARHCFHACRKLLVDGDHAFISWTAETSTIYTSSVRTRSTCLTADPVQSFASRKPEKAVTGRRRASLARPSYRGRASQGESDGQLPLNIRDMGGRRSRATGPPADRRLLGP